MDVRHLLDYWQESPPVDTVVRAFVMGDRSGSDESGRRGGTMHELAGELGAVVPSRMTHG